MVPTIELGRLLQCPAAADNPHLRMPSHECQQRNETKFSEKKLCFALTTTKNCKTRKGQP